jgi:hypothetical protein
MCPALIKSSSLRSHIQQLHTGDFIKCSECSYKSRRPGDVKGHYKRIHTPKDPEEFTICPGCGRFLQDKKIRDAHLSRTSCGGKPKAILSCDQCDKKFGFKHSLRKHIDNIHRDGKYEQCGFCEYKSYSGYNLKLHVTKMHEGRKMEKQQCLFCDKSMYQLDGHVKLYHT